MREFIREKVKRYSKAANAIFWVGILNIFSFILLLFRGGIPRLGFALNIYFHVLFICLKAVYRHFFFPDWQFWFYLSSIFFLRLRLKAENLSLWFLPVFYILRILFFWFLWMKIFFRILRIALFPFLFISWYSDIIFSFFFIFIVSSNYQNPIKRNSQKKEKKNRIEQKSMLEF